MRSLLIRTLMGALVFLCSGIYAYGQTFSLPSTSTTGSYSISYSASGSMGIIEEWNGSLWGGIGGGQKTGTIAVTKTVSGTYLYRMQNCNPGQTGSNCAIVSGTKSITVTIASPADPLACIGAANTITYCYDDLGRVSKVIHPNGVKNTYTYDSADNRTKKESTAN